MKELRFVYNDTNNPMLAQRRATGQYSDKSFANNRNLRNFGPESHGYPAGAARRELMAEAIRAYMADPNYLKTVAPNTAARIRSAVNSNPRIAPYIQFNSILGLGTTGVGAGTAAALLGLGQEDRR